MNRQDAKYAKDKRKKGELVNFTNDLGLLYKCKVLKLVTHNTGEFGRVTGLQIEDWEES